MKTVLAATLILPVATLWVIAHTDQQEIDPNRTLRQRLRDFIALVDSIDFDTEAVDQHTVGREQVLAAREKARTLLSELV